MLIGVRRRFVFVANSKTASTSVEALLTPYAEINRVGSPERKHIAWRDIRTEYSFLFDQPGYSPTTFLKFGIIREPVEWVRSWFNYRKGNREIEQPLPHDMTFEAFWKSADWVKNIRQRDKFVDDYGNVALDVVIPYEELHELTKEILDILFVKEKALSRENISRGGCQRKDIPDHIIDEIRKHYQDDEKLYHEWRIKARGVIGKIAAERLAVVNAGKGRLQVSPLKSELPWVLHAAIDGVPNNLDAGQPFEIGGVVVLSDQAPKGCELQLHGSGEYHVKWNIDSPIMEQRYPKGANRAHARFRISSVYRERDTGYDMAIAAGDERIPLFHIKVSRPG